MLGRVSQLQDRPARARQECEERRYGPTATSPFPPPAVPVRKRGVNQANPPGAEPARPRRGPPRVPSRAAGGTSGRRPRGGEGRRESGPRSALPYPALPGSWLLPADGVRLAGLRLRGAGGHGRCRGLRQGRQRPFSSCRASVRRLSGTRRLPAVQRSEECVAFPRGVWHLVCCYGNEILQLQKGNAWDNCWCQFTDGWTAWIADDGKNLLSYKSASSDLKTHD